MKNYERIKGMIAATFTPIKENGDINYDEIKHYADYLANTPIKGVFVNGTTGEFTSLTINERKKLLEVWIKEAGGRFKVIGHIGSNCQRDSAELAAHAQANGADAIGSIAPSFFKPATVQDLVDYFIPIASAASELPFYYYNMPSMTGVNLPVDKFLSLGHRYIPNLVGTKFTHNNLMEMGACINLDGGSFEVLHGYDEILISGIAMGSKGGVGSTYNYIPDIYDGIFQTMEANDIETARVLQMKSIRTVEVIIKYGGGVRGGKAIMNLIGIKCGQCRPPIARMSKDEYDALYEDVNTLGFINRR